MTAPLDLEEVEARIITSTQREVFAPFIDEIRRLRAELEALTAAREALLDSGRALDACLYRIGVAEGRTHVQAVLALAGQRDTARAEVERLRAENEAQREGLDRKERALCDLTAHCDRAHKEIGKGAIDRGLLTAERDTAIAERDAARTDRDEWKAECLSECGKLRARVAELEGGRP